MDKNKLHNIDEQILNKVGDYEVSYNPDHWDKMQHRLEALDAQDADFDSNLRGRMGNIDVISSNIHWDKMADKLKALDAEEATFDESMKERMENLQKDYRNAHWQMMNQRLDEEFSWRNKIVRYKVAEVALMALLIFTVFNYFDTDTNNEYHYTPTKLENPQEKIKSFNKGTDWRNKNNNPNTQPSKQGGSQPIVSNEGGDNILFLNKNNVFPNQNTLDGSTFTLESNNLNPLLNTINNQNIVATNSTNQAQEEAIKTTKQGESFNELFLKSLSSLRIASIYPREDLNLNITKNKSNQPIAEVKPINPLRPKALTINSFLGEEPIIASDFTKKKNKWWRFGIFGSSTIDVVSSSFILKEGNFTRSVVTTESLVNGRDIRPNKSAGLTVGYKKGKVELESGLTYHEKQYTPVKVTLQTGSISYNDLRDVVITPKTVDLDIVSLPLSMSYSPIEKTKWSVYTKLGGAFNTIANLNTVAYQNGNDKIAQEQKNILALKSVGNSLPNIDINENEVPIYKEGLLQSYNLKNNFYITGQAAVGVEYKFSNALSAYLQPTVDVLIGNLGIGSRNDRLNTLSLQAGLKMNFKKN